MEPYMTNSQWTTFCDEIEESLKPVNKATKIAYVSFGLTFITFIVVMIISFVSFSSGFGGGFDDDFFTGGGGGSDGGNNGGPSAFVLFAVPAGTMFLGMATICYASSKAQKATIEIQRICKETSDRQPRLSFHVRYEYSFYPSYGSSSHFHHGTGIHGTSSNFGHHHHGHTYRTHRTQYIEVSILQNTTTTSIPTSSLTVAESSLYPPSYHPAYTSANSTSPAGGAGTTVQDRLQTLENTKHLLTQNKYDQKRAEILSSI